MSKYQNHGGTPVNSEGHSRRAQRIYARYLCQSLGWSWATLLIIFFKVPTIRSTKPELWWCPGVLKRGLHPIRFRNSLFNLLVKLVALSLEIVAGIPVIIHNCRMFSCEWPQRVTAKGKRQATSLHYHTVLNSNYTDMDNLLWALGSP